MTKVVSLDTSTSSTGYAVFENGRYARCGCIDKKKDKLTSEERLDVMCKAILAILEEEKPDIVYWETPSMTRNAVTQRALTTVVGVVYGWCLSHDVYHEDFRPSVWRKWCLEPYEKVPVARVELKQWSVKKVKQFYGIDVNDDIADAVLIGCGAISYYKRREEKVNGEHK